MTRFPEWLRRPIPTGSVALTQEILSELKLNTVCESALCPNRMECYSRQTATFMILGDVCTRRCGFCAIQAGKPLLVEEDEPERVAEAAKQLGLKHVVVTSVTRDDLKDEGANHFARTIEAIRCEVENVTIEILTPDFHARRELIEIVCKARPDVFNHNVETVERLSRLVRPQARYRRSLEVLELVKTFSSSIVTKSGLMLGLGESVDEVIQTLVDLKSVQVDIVTIGQYLRPDETSLAVKEFVHPEVFAHFESEGKKLGFREVYAGPYVRSSYHAAESYSKSLEFVKAGGE